MPNSADTVNLNWKMLELITVKLSQKWNVISTNFANNEKTYHKSF